MNKTEMIAKKFLKYKSYSNIIYEPDGNIPPDFSISNNIGIEVRRLNLNYFFNDKYKGFEEIEIPLLMKMRSILSSYHYRNGSSWFVNYSYNLPIETFKVIENEVRSLLDEFLKKENKNNFCKSLDCGLEIKIYKANKTYDEKFKLGGYHNLDTTGWVLDIFTKNIKLCIEEKTIKISKHRHKYNKWWLYLVDYICYGLNKSEKSIIEDKINIKNKWDKVVIISPNDFAESFELQN
ncbi:MAG: hypothetical protein ACOCV1_05220 [Bacillota bacterium]